MENDCNVAHNGIERSSIETIHTSYESNVKTIRKHNWSYQNCIIAILKTMVKRDANKFLNYSPKCNIIIDVTTREKSLTLQAEALYNRHHISIEGGRGVP